MDWEKIEQDMNGLGKKVNRMEIEMGRFDERIKQNEIDTRDLWTIVNEIRTDIKGLTTSIGAIPLKIIGIVSIPTFLVLIQLIFTALHKKI